MILEINGKDEFVYDLHDISEIIRKYYNEVLSIEMDRLVEKQEIEIEELENKVNEQEEQIEELEGKIWELEDELADVV